MTSNEQPPTGEAAQSMGGETAKTPLSNPIKGFWMAPVPELRDADYARFVEKFLKTYQIDLNLYKERQMRRRINMMLSLYDLKTYDQLLDRMAEDEKVRTRFFDRLTINVSEFFRNPERWDSLEKEILLPMAARGEPMSIFCAGCSTGEEPYSLAILALEHGWKNVTIHAWDLDQDALNRAMQGRYLARQVEQVRPDRLARHFRPDGDYFVIDERVKGLVKFEKHNLLEDPLGGPHDLLLCRNVVIYFTEEAKDDLFRRFVESLKPGGYLFVGSTERVVHYQELGLVFASPFIYRRMKMAK